MNVNVRMLLAVATVTLVHLTVLDEFAPGGIRADALLLVAVLAGMVGGPERGAIVGFLAGFAADLFLQTPFGLSAMAFTLVGFGTGTLQTGILRSAWWIPIAVAFFGSAAGTIVYALVGATVGQTTLVSSRLPLVALVVGLLNAVLALPVQRLTAWSLKEA